MKALVFLAVAAALNATAASGQVFTPKDFRELSSLQGQGWTVTRFSRDQYNWGARFEADGKVLHEIDGADHAHLLKCLLWPDESNPKLLFILRETTGSHSPMMLDAVQLAGGFPRVLTTDRDRGFSFAGDESRIEDLDGDGWPEVSGYDIHYACMPRFLIDVSCAESPYPRVVMAYDQAHGYYRPATWKYPDANLTAAGEAQQAFEDLWGSRGLVPAEVLLEGWPRASEAPKETRDAYLFLFRWALYTLYAGRPNEAWEILAAHADPVLAKMTRQYLQQESRGDYNYYDMESWKRESEEGKGKP